MPAMPNDPIADFFGIEPEDTKSDPKIPRKLINETIVILGHPYSKKNNQTVVQRGNHSTVVYKPNYTKWANSAYKQLAETYGHAIPIDEPVNLQCRFYLGYDYSPDLSGMYEGIQDVLVKAEVLSDDNYKIITSHNGSGVALDRERPRIEVTITRKG